jgi:signal transduction histidine kinase
MLRLTKLVPEIQGKPMTEQGKNRVEFVSATVHELKTSLTPIIASAELLADELHPDDKSLPAKLIANIIRNAHRLDEKLSNFAKMSELLTGDFPFQPEFIEVGPVIQSITTEFYPITKSKRQSLTLNLPASLPTIKADRQYLEQVLLNLLTNASKFTPEGGKITISATSEDGRLVIQVADSGMGIPAEKQELIFQPYYQINGGRGSGLGLAITKFLVELHGGKIWLEGATGKGRTFSFSLPLK